MSGDRCADCGRVDCDRPMPFRPMTVDCALATVTRLRAEVEALRGRAEKAEREREWAYQGQTAIRNTLANITDQLHAAQKRIEGLEAALRDASNAASFEDCVTTLDIALKSFLPGGQHGPKQEQPARRAPPGAP